MKIAVIGAGPAGMTAAYELSRRIGQQVGVLDLYEKSDCVGGLAKSITLWDQRVDLGPHRFFSHDSQINSFWLEVVGRNYDLVNRQTRIFYQNRFFDYPIRAMNALSGLGCLEASRCLLSYFAECLSPSKSISTFEEWVTRRFGKRLYSIFFKTYTEKLWGIPCEELDSDFAAQRIKKLSLFEALKNALYQGKGNKLATLADQFAYPVGGTGSVYESMQKTIRERGGNVYLNSKVKRVITSGGIVHSLELENGEVREYDHIISTMPISSLVAQLPEAPSLILDLSEKLVFRNTILVYLQIDHHDLFPDQWLYIHDPAVEAGRVTNFRNWLPSLYGNSRSTILCMEYWCSFDDPMWSWDQERLISMAKKDIILTEFVKEEDIIKGHVVHLPKSYPVYFNGYRRIMEPIEGYLSSVKGLHAIGRYGAYKYNNQDHSILMGLRVAENIVERAGHNLWPINTDYEIYQEASVITETGLVTERI